ncbi:hypothetical protein [Amycolatopsis sp. cmx-4-61]|uniref:hypothetical protein n=1 Tax=Amycolatopsis sp. cmx-4-61 TaxID=2790937 RepID=UPI00397D501E
MPVTKQGGGFYAADELVEELRKEKRVQARVRANEITVEDLQRLATRMINDRTVYAFSNVYHAALKLMPAAAQPPPPSAASLFQPNLDTRAPGVECMMPGQPRWNYIPASFTAKEHPDEVNVHPDQTIGFSFKLLFRVAPDAGTYQVGCTQTALAVQRTCELRPDVLKPARAALITIQLSGPANDRSPSATAPWFADGQTFGPQTLPPGQVVEATPALLDRPGYDFKKSEISRQTGIPNLVLHEIGGTDSFCTWVILREVNTGVIYPLYYALWSITYKDKSGVVSLDDQGWHSGPARPVFDGQRAVDAHRLDITSVVL